MKTILLPTDFSPCSLHAIRYALYAFKPESHQYVLCNTHFVPSGGASMVVSIDDLMAEESQKQLRELRQELCAEFGLAISKFEVLSLKGTVREGVGRILSQMSIDLIVMGSHGASGWKKAIIGSNAASILKSVDCPLLMVPKNKIIVPPTHMGVAIDDVDHKVQLQHWIPAYMSNNWDTKITGFHVENDPVDYATREQRTHKSGLQFNGEDHDVETIPFKDVVDGILTYTRENDINFLVVMRRDRGWIESLFHESISAETIMESKVPILVLPD